SVSQVRTPQPSTLVDCKQTNERTPQPSGWLLGQFSARYRGHTHDTAVSWFASSLTSFPSCLSSPSPSPILLLGPAKSEFPDPPRPFTASPCCSGYLASRCSSF